MKGLMQDEVRMDARTRSRSARRAVAVAVAALGLASMSRTAAADEASEPIARRYTLEQAVAEALANHPRIRASVAGESDAEARVDEARTARLPDVGISAQINRSTGNTVP